ncbi:MAG TPA: ABC transporter ATP-binding protein [Myxococcota bacterium]|jgi:ATP-binding cassette subfamily C protein|nr:ABC transporter ATP-binding protein [Myxococcota bacterium]
MKLLREFVREHPGYSVTLLVSLLVASVLEGVGLLSLLPLVDLAVSPGGGSMLSGPSAAVASKSSAHPKAVLQSVFAALGITPSLGAVLIVILVAFALRSVILLLARRHVGNTVAALVRELRLRLVRALLRARWSYYVRQRVGSFGNAYAAEAQRAASAFVHLTYMVTHALQFVIYGAIAVATSWRATLASAALGSVIVMVLNGLVKMGRRAGQRQTRLSKGLLGRLTDVLQGVKPMKAMGREELVTPLLEDGTLRLERAMRKDTYATEVLTAFGDTMTIAILCAGIYLMLGVYHIEVGQALLLTVLAYRIFDVVNKFQRRQQKAAVDESAYWSLRRTIEEAEGNAEAASEGAEPRFEHAIELAGVVFSYDEGVLFDALELVIPAGGITALVGPSGAGKTTVVDLVAGLVQPRAGEVRIDGVPLGKLDLRAWRRRIGYVPQEMFLLHDTVAINVSLGDPHVSRAQIERALARGHAADFVARLPQGIDTVVGERGAALSGGQRQRVAIARALVHEPWLLVLDEATTALDPESEAAVWAAIEELRGSMTVLAISHQMTLLGVADRVYRISRGRAERLERGAVTERADAR